jgi:hypothetical protein
VRFEVLTAASMEMTVLWVVAPFSVVEIYRRFRVLPASIIRGMNVSIPSYTVPAATWTWRLSKKFLPAGNRSPVSCLCPFISSAILNGSFEPWLASRLCLSVCQPSTLYKHLYCRHYMFDFHVTSYESEHA